MAYTFENDGTWGSYDDGIKGLTEFHQKRKSLGFTESKKLTSLLGSVTVYPRTTGTAKWSYNYVCLVEVVNGYVWVWVKNVPTLFSFLQSIQANREAKTTDVYISNADELKDVYDVPSYLNRTCFEEAMKELYKYFEKKNGE